MGDVSIDHSISNGTCYYGVNKESPSTMLACGNSAIDTVSCCQAGDMCLNYSNCFDEDAGLLYIGGCTDPEYGGGPCSARLLEWSTFQPPPAYFAFYVYPALVIIRKACETQIQV